MTDPAIGASTDAPYDAHCAECHRPIRLSRWQTTAAGDLAFYCDEDGMETGDFHFHLPPA